MKCDLPIELLSGYLDEELNEEQLARVKKHLGECAVCRKELEELKKLDEHMRSAVTEEPSREFVFNLNRQVMDKIRKKSRSSIFKFSPIFVPVAIAVLVLIVLVNIPGPGKLAGLDQRILYSETEVRISCCTTKTGCMPLLWRSVRMMGLMMNSSSSMKSMQLQRAPLISGFLLSQM